MRLGYSSYLDGSMKLIELCDEVLDTHEKCSALRMLAIHKQNCVKIARACKLMYEDLINNKHSGCTLYGRCKACDAKEVLDKVDKLTEEK